MKIHKNILLFVILSMVFLGLLFAFLFLFCRVPKTAATEGTLTTISRRIRRYVKLNNEIPYNLSNLPILKGFGNKTEDAWGNDFIYEVNDTVVTLISFGRDGKAGGEGEDADITRIFNAYENLDDPFCGVTFPQYKTYGIMSCIATRIQLYVSNNGQLPNDISSLPELKPSTSEDHMQPWKFQNGIIDHWGKEITYKRISPTKFQLFSYGADSKEGGIAQYSDMERIFELDDKGECVEIHFNLRDE